MRSRYLLTGRGRYPTGSQPPPGYLQWHSWAEDQARAGLKQRTCSLCGKYRFPQEFANEMACNECFKAHPPQGKGGCRVKVPFIIGFLAYTLALAGCDKPTPMPLTVDSYRSNEVNLLVEAVDAGWSMRERGISRSNALWSARALLENRMTIKQLIEMRNY